MAPLEVTFEVCDGDVWIDPENVAWNVVGPDPNDNNDVFLQRTVTTSVPARDLVRTWRRMGETHPNFDTPFGHDEA